MDQLPNQRRGRLRPVTIVLLLVALALAATAWLAPDVLAQTIDAGKAAKAPGATIETAAGEAIENAPGAWGGAIKVGIVIALFVVPIAVGNWLAKTLKMPDHGWKFAVAIGTIAAAAVVVSTGEIKLGPDLSGGITLIYELADDTVNPPTRDVAVETEQSDDDKADKSADNLADAEDAKDDDAAEEDAPRGPTDPGVSRDATIALLIDVLSERIDPSGTKEISIRKWGEGSIEIVIPRAEKQELEFIERKISTAGSLVFRITASPKFGAHKTFIDLANKLPAGQDIVKLSGKEVARWVQVDETEFPSAEVAQGRGLVTRTSRKVLQALVMTNDGLDVTGDDLKTVASGTDQIGKPQVEFSFNSNGAWLFGQLTGTHTPNASNGQKYNLGILLDNRLLSAPTINDKITDRGTISGNMSEEDVNFLVGILQAGRLPAALNKVPISRAQISPTLGAQTIEKGKLSLMISLVVVAIFMMVYYRACGVIACFGLAINMLLIVGCMVLIKAAFTLPGLAGLVLTVGMSVDANVLIYERIREELKRGAALRMAIRNGFDRASITIIDSNVTNLITGIVIYKIAPDNVKGFGITLVLGIAMSIFVAVFLTRIAFDVLERKSIIKKLHMMQFIGETNMDFLGWRRVCIAGSLLLIGVGLLAAAARRDDLFDIDFTGGSSVQFVLQDDEAMEFDDVWAALQETSLADKNLSLVKVGQSNTHYSVTTIDDNITGVEKILGDAFADKLETYDVEVSDVTPIPAEDAVGMIPLGINTRLAGDWSTPMSLVTLLQAAPADDAPATAPAGDAATEDAVAEDADAEDADAEEAATASSAGDGDADAEAAADAIEAADSGNPFAAGGASATLRFSTPDQAASEGLSAGVSYETLEQLLVTALKDEDREGVAYEITNDEYEPGSARNFVEWQIKLALSDADAQAVFDRIEAQLDNQPVFPLSNKIGGRVAARMATDAVAAIILCLAGIIGYVWFRFHGVVYGIAAVVALVHDVLIALGAVALSAYFVQGVEPLANALLIDKFQVSLTLVAAFLTIIGYSLNDTIVIFDRIREVKGKSPRLTAEMINLAVNQCFARTLLTSFTSLISVTVLYIVGGTGIHAFAFALLIGFVAGVYSTIYIANPVLLWLSQRADAAAAKGTGSRAA